MGDEVVTRDGALIRRFRDGFQDGYTPITEEGERGLETGMDFGIHVQPGGSSIDECHAKESVWVLLDGRATLVFGGQEEVVARASLFDEPPSALHLGPNTRVRIHAESPRVEWAVARATNPRSFAARLFLPHEIEPEYRGLGLAQGACLRNVRLIFDRHVRPAANIVIGEVINYPGRWSSYPPHHHAQPEIYHYRFTRPQGYGHGEVGERVYKVRQYDTLRIPGMHDHAQVAAPGYGMYYLWIVRHLENDPYVGFEFSEDHQWILDEDASAWEPSHEPWPGRTLQAGGRSGPPKRASTDSESAQERCSGMESEPGS
ncbi:MAG: 5-deoxy-glucuronate isomerase [Candidatus Krumholzibacteriia bacterium]